MHEVPVLVLQVLSRIIVILQMLWVSALQLAWTSDPQLIQAACVLHLTCVPLELIKHCLRSPRFARKPCS